MSNLEARPEQISAGAVRVAEEPAWELLEGREVALGGTRAMGADSRPGDSMMVTRILPHRERRMVGAWCFVDHFGAAGPASMGMRIPPHPHTGLQTVTWLLSGQVMHRDSLGSAQLIEPGQLNLMTAGHAIAHAEVSRSNGPLHGVQLWTALPEVSRAVAPHFEHHPDLPAAVEGAATVAVLMGDFAGLASPARTYAPLVGAQVSLRGPAMLPLRLDFEYAALQLTGTVHIDGRELPPGPMLYLGRERRDLRLDGDGQLLLLGGEPFDEEIVMWWNFIGRSHDEIVADREDWMAGRRFGTVAGDDDPLPAPPMPTTTLRPRGRLRPG